MLLFTIRFVQSDCTQSNYDMPVDCETDKHAFTHRSSERNMYFVHGTKCMNWTKL